MGKCIGGMLAPALAASLTIGSTRLLSLAGPELYLGYGVGYALLGLATLVALRQCRPGWHAAMRRLVALLAGAGVAAGDVALSGLAEEAAQQAFFSALLGVALVQVLAKWLDRKAVSPPPGRP